MVEQYNVWNYAEINKYEKVNMDCDIHGNTEALVNGECRACKDDKIRQEEKRIQEQKILEQKQHSGIKERYLNALFSNYKIEHIKQQEVVNILKSFDGEKNIILTGSVGTGKTHLSCALIDRLLRLNKSCYYVKFYELAKIQIQDKKLFDLIIKKKFLIIDEYGVSESDYKSNLLFEVIDQRYDAVCFTMLISNLNREKIKEKMQSALYSRLKEDSISMGCNWDDYRLKGSK